MGARPIAEALIVCQPQEVPISSEWDEILYQAIQMEEEQIKDVHYWPGP